MAKGLEIEYAHKARPTNILNFLFMSTVNAAAKSLVSVASNIKTEHPGRWKPTDHLRFMVMLMTWTTVWALRVLMDYFPIPTNFSPRLLLGGLSPIGSLLSLPAASGSSSSSRALTNYNSSSMDLILEEDIDFPSVNSLSRSLTQILALLNDLPASSRKYQFAMAMADKVMEGNYRDGNSELVHVNRTALSSAFSRTTSLLYRTLQQPSGGDESGALALTTRVVRTLPLGNYVATYMKGFNTCIRMVLQAVGSASGGWQLEKRNQGAGSGEGVNEVLAEKLAQELLWITHKLRAYGAVDEALVQWSFASGLASIALNSNPRVQGSIVKISAVLVKDLSITEVSREVKFRLLVLWVPLFCHANNGLCYPVLTNWEKADVERAMDEVISTLPAMEQEVVLTNWLQDFAVTASEWPNLQVSYDRWCQCTRELVV